VVPTLCNGTGEALISTVPLSSLIGAVGPPTSYSVTVYQLGVCRRAVFDPDKRGPDIVFLRSTVALSPELGSLFILAFSADFLRELGSTRRTLLSVNRQSPTPLQQTLPRYTHSLWLEAGWQGRLSVCLSVWLSVCLSVCLSVWLAGWLAGAGAGGRGRASSTRTSTPPNLPTKFAGPRILSPTLVRQATRVSCVCSECLSLSFPLLLEEASPLGSKR